MNAILVPSSFVAAGATVRMLIFTWLNYRMYREIEARNDQQQQHFEDLLQAVVIATLLSGPSSYGAYADCKKTFQKEYKGTTPVFREKGRKTVQQALQRTRTGRAAEV